MALIVTLGILTALVLLAIAFSVGSRTERLAARNFRDRTAARQFVDVALQLSMQCAATYQDRALGVLTYPQAWGLPALPSVSDQAFGWWPTNEVPFGGAVHLFSAAAAVHVPAALWAQASNTVSYWQYIIGTNEFRLGETTNGRVAFLVLDGTGFFNVHAVSNTHAAVLVDVARTQDVARIADPAAGTVFASQADLNARGTNWGLYAPVSSLVVCTFDPDPDVTVSNWTAGLGTPTVMVMRAYNVNLWTNEMPGRAASSPDPRRYIASPPAAWLNAVTGRLDAIGCFPCPPAIAWNMLNYMDGDRIPQSDTEHAWREDWPVEDVPLINEIAVLEVDPATLGDPAKSNHYAVAVELWYPFVPGRIQPSDVAKVVVGVFTNDPAAVSPRPTVNEMLDASHRGDFGFDAIVPEMEYGSSVEFVVVTSPLPRAVSFPVMIVYPPGPNGEQHVPQQETLYLPIGPTAYPVYRFDVAASDWVVDRWVAVINKIRVLARTAIGNEWVDEAPGYEPADYDLPPQQAERLLVAFQGTWSMSVDDPRHNGRWRNWKGGDVHDPGWLTLGTTNANCRPWHRYGQGLPIVHRNAPMQRAGEIGYVATTDAWESVCLADDRFVRVATNLNAVFTCGSVLDWFTARSEAGPARNLVHYGTPWTNVAEAVLADIPFGWGTNLLHADAQGLAWLTTCLFDSREALLRRQGITPSTRGEMALGFGLIDAYRDGPVGWPGSGSIGMDLKEDLIRGLAERVSFRQNMYFVVLAAQSLTPAGRVAADQRAVATVARDAFTGRWHLLNWRWLTE